MTPLVAVILGIVEGLTEYLPVSSTGHLILVGSLLHAEGEGMKSFEIVIQLGAILAVAVHYRHLLADRLRGLIVGRPEARRLFASLFAAFLPTMVAGLLLRKVVKAHLFGIVPVAGAFIVGGVVMVAVDFFRRRSGARGEEGLEHVDVRRGFLIGLGQCISLWPGSSRSMCTIVAGQLTGLSTATAAEFSFLLALPTLGAATLYEAYKGRHELATQTTSVELILGMVVSFLVAWAVIAAFLKYLRTRGLTPFGIYRIVLGIVVFMFLR